MKENEMIQEVQPKKLNKKGFSLVELIVVIAIMAILVGIVGMAVLPQIEKAREAKDMQVISGLCTSATSAFASEAANLEAGKEYKFELETTDPTPADDGGKKVLATIRELQSCPSSKSLYTYIKEDLESKAMSKNISKIVIEFAGDSTGVVKAYAVGSGTTILLEAVSSK